MDTIEVNTTKRNELIDITSNVEQSISTKDGICVVYVPHTTAAVTINENADPDVKDDIISILSGLIPKSPSYKHMEGNSDAHTKASLIGSSQTIIVKDGRLVLGTWQSIFFCEFDGPRNRKVYVNFQSS